MSSMEAYQSGKQSSSLMATRFQYHDCVKSIICDWQEVCNYICMLYIWQGQPSGQRFGHYYYCLQGICIVRVCQLSASSTNIMHASPVAVAWLRISCTFFSRGICTALKWHICPINTVSAGVSPRNMTVLFGAYHLSVSSCL